LISTLEFLTALGDFKNSAIHELKLNNDVNNVPIRIYGTMMDISDRKTTEASLLAMKNVSAISLKIILSVMLLMDQRTGNIH
jgi:uncharacterized membrane protein